MTRFEAAVEEIQVNKQPCQNAHFHPRHTLFFFHAEAFDVNHLCRQLS